MTIKLLNPPLKRFLMLALLALLLFPGGCTTHRSAFAPAVETTAVPAEASGVPPVSPTSPPEPKAEAEPFAPFAVSSQLDIPLPDHLFTGGFEVRGSLAAPVNTAEADRDFFTNPRFDKKGNSGRLFSSITSLYNRYVPKATERSVAFICWKPAAPDGGGGGGADEDNNDAMMAQLLPARDGYAVYEVTTDGKRLFVQFAPQYGTKNVGKPVDVYVWKGDVYGKGRFVPRNNKPFPRLRAAAPPEGSEWERDRGFDALTAARPDEAVEAFGKAIKRKPGDAASHYGLGIALERSSKLPQPKRMPGVFAAFSRAVELDPTYTEAWRERGIRYGEQKKWEKAVADATKVVALEPKDPVGFIERAQYYSASGVHDKGAADALAATRLKPEEREYWEYAALELYRAGRYDDAVRSANRALDNDDARNVARLVLACIYARRDQTQKALRQIKDAQDNGVSRSERVDGLREIKKALGARPTSAALHAIYRALSGDDQLEPDGQ